MQTSKNSSCDSPPQSQPQLPRDRCPVSRRRSNECPLGKLVGELKYLTAAAGRGRRRSYPLPHRQLFFDAVRMGPFLMVERARPENARHGEWGGLDSDSVAMVRARRPQSKHPTVGCRASGSGHTVFLAYDMGVALHGRHPGYTVAIHSRIVRDGRCGWRRERRGSHFDDGGRCGGM